jgi:hypothetical protein
VSFSEATGQWKDTGKPEDLLEANRVILETMLPANEAVILGKVDVHSDIAEGSGGDGGADYCPPDQGPSHCGRSCGIKRQVQPARSIKRMAAMASRIGYLRGLAALG